VHFVGLFFVFIYEKFLPFEQRQLESNPLSAVHDTLLITFIVTSESAVTFFHPGMDIGRRQQIAKSYDSFPDDMKLVLFVKIPRPLGLPSL